MISNHSFNVDLRKVLLILEKGNLPNNIDNFNNNNENNPEIQNNNNKELNNLLKGENFMPGNNYFSTNTNINNFFIHNNNNIIKNKNSKKALFTETNINTKRKILNENTKSDFNDDYSNIDLLFDN